MERKVSLYFSDIQQGGTSDKEYHVQVQRQGEGFVVNFQYGRRGGPLQTGSKTSAPVGGIEAVDIFERLVREKVNKGYAPSMETKSVKTLDAGEKSTQFPVELLEEITRQECDGLIRSNSYWMQVKVDGHRRQIEKLEPGRYGSFNKLGKLVTSLPEEIVYEMERIPAKSFLLDGELIGKGYIAFDLLQLNGKDLSTRPYHERFSLLEKLLGLGVQITAVETWKTPREKTAGLAQLYLNRCEGAVFKNIDAAYRAGESCQHKKFKFLKSASCRVMGIRVNGKQSALLALRDGSNWFAVGCASTIGKGRIAVNDIVEVTFLYTTAGRQLFQPRIKEVRDDVKMQGCTMKQLKGTFKEGVEEAA